MVSLPQQASDICSIATSVTVLALSVLFFLSFSQTLPVSLDTVSVKDLQGTVTKGSCSFGTLQDSKILRSADTSVLNINTFDVTILSNFNISAIDLIGMPQFTLPCTTFTPKRSARVMGISSGSYEIVQTPDATRPGENCGGFLVNKTGLFYMGYYRISPDLWENHVLESVAPIDINAPVGTGLFRQAFQKVAGPDIDVLSTFGGGDLSEYLDRIKEIRFSCTYKPKVNVTAPEFALNVAVILTAILGMFVQTCLVISHHVRTPPAQPNDKLTSPL